MVTEATHQTKLPYEKPKLRVIDLAAEEILGIGCKTSTTGGQANPTSCLTLPCIQDGS